MRGSDKNKKQQRPKHFLFSSLQQSVAHRLPEDLFSKVYGAPTPANNSNNNTAAHYHHHRSFNVKTPKTLLFYFIICFLGMPLFFFAWKETHWNTQQQHHDHHIRTSLAKQHNSHHVHPSWMDDAAAPLHDQLHLPKNNDSNTTDSKEEISNPHSNIHYSEQQDLIESNQTNYIKEDEDDDDDDDGDDDDSMQTQEISLSDEDQDSQDHQEDIQHDTQQDETDGDPPIR